MCRRGMKLSDAYELVKQKKPIIKPNQGFYTQLLEFEKQLYGANITAHVKSTAECQVSTDMKEVDKRIQNGTIHSSSLNVQNGFH